MSATHAVSGFSRSTGPGLSVGLIAWLRGRLRKLLPSNWLLSRSNDIADELIVAQYGPVEIRRTLAGWSLETCVKGEPDRARDTALRRLSSYVDGKNRSSMRLRAARPLVQTEESFGRWRIRIALPGVDSDFVAASGHKGRVRLRALDSETLAVIRVPGRPTKLAIQHAETAIRHAIAPTGWEAAGCAMLRLHSLPTVLPFLGRFEVALPVVEREHGSVLPDWTRSIAFTESSAREARTQPSPPVR
jgi:hypothetical protein